MKNVTVWNSLFSVYQPDVKVSQLSPSRQMDIPLQEEVGDILLLRRLMFIPRMV